MYRIIICCSFLLIALLNKGFAQCTALGQNPGTAFPVCGTSTFSQTTVPICGGQSVPSPCGAGAGLTDKNPFWYQFTCFTSGLLSFVITPSDANEDYDWQIFDITNRNPADVYTDASLFVACNWSGEPGNTGASAAGTQAFVCGSTGTGPRLPLFTTMPSLIEGHTYIMLVSHFSDSQSGYSLSFGGGTASITDPTTPHLLSARAPCEGIKISVKLNKKMKCNSIDADGSDFSIIPAVAPIIGAVGVGCSSSFDMDSVVLTLGGPLLPGNYKIAARNNNNLLDNCDRPIPTGDTLNVTVYPLIPTPMDSLEKIGCAPDVLKLVFRTPMQCSSIAADGSDFVLTGGITVASAEGICNSDGLTDVIFVRLSAPVSQAGNFQLRLVTGSDGSTIINECGQPTAAGASLPFTTVDTVSAVFTTSIKFGCFRDTVNYSHDGAHGVNSWLWTFNNSLKSSLRDTSIIYPVTGTDVITLIVTNGTCRDTATMNLALDNAIKVDFESTSVVCPGDPAIFINKSTGSLNNSWVWNFGNGVISTDKDPAPQLYPEQNSVVDIPVTLTVSNTVGCTQTVRRTIRVVNNCYIAVPKAFTPNDDGLNDFLYPTNAYKAKDLLFRVYNRGGQMIFETRNWLNQWDGRFKGSPQDPGTYVWVLSYTHIDTGLRYESKGSTVLMR